MFASPLTRLATAGEPDFAAACGSPLARLLDIPRHPGRLYVDGMTSSAMQIASLRDIADQLESVPCDGVSAARTGEAEAWKSFGQIAASGHLHDAGRPCQC